MSIQPVLLTWVDIEDHPGWHQRDLIPYPAHMQAVGFLVDENEFYVALATTFAPGEAEEEDCQGVTVFPRGCVISIKPLETK